MSGYERSVPIDGKSSPVDSNVSVLYLSVSSSNTYPILFLYTSLAASLSLKDIAIHAPTTFYSKTSQSTLGQGGSNEFLDYIFQAVRDPQPIVRACAADALSQCLKILMERQHLSLTGKYLMRLVYVTSRPSALIACDFTRTPLPDPFFCYRRARTRDNEKKLECHQ